MIDYVRTCKVTLALLAGALMLLQLAPARAEENSHAAIMLVAKPEVHDPFYAASVLIVRPLENGGHAGFVLNKPTKVSLGEAFPDDEPSQKVHQPVFLGGPVNPDVIFALVKRNDPPVQGEIEFAKDLHLALTAESVDRVIQQDAGHARFFAGAVLWRPGELDEELKRGAWYVMDADTDLALASKPEELWSTLLKRSEKRARTGTAPRIRSEPPAGSVRL